MTLSLSSFVRSCFRVSVRTLFFLLVSLKFLLVLKSVNGVSRQFKECLKFNGSFKAVSRKFKGCFTGVSMKFQECLTKFIEYFQVSRVLQGSLKSVSRKFKGNYKGV